MFESFFDNHCILIVIGHMSWVVEKHEFNGNSMFFLECKVINYKEPGSVIDQYYGNSYSRLLDLNFFASFREHEDHNRSSLKRRQIHYNRYIYGLNP